MIRLPITRQHVPIQTPAGVGDITLVHQGMLKYLSALAIGTAPQAHPAKLADKPIIARVVDIYNFSLGCDRVRD
ncbi:hypothetical protein IV04_24620 [Serratia sp. Ag1]|nr:MULTISPECIES: hypothetical protein [unclassified Serratia (in: enterobacteria)]KFK91679.1 hypothetical protein JV45_25025 [Serratia sp. Ag2]KFK92594.1 hypothetical protein IV04_24620 [Serratia sp. Ag1]